MPLVLRHLVLISLSVLLLSCNNNSSVKLDLPKNARIVLIGNNLCARMMEFGSFETEMHLRFPEHQLFIRNMCDAGNTPGFRPHSARNSPWAFPDAEKFYPNEYGNKANSKGHFPTEDEWLHTLAPDIILAFFGYNESFRGADGLQNFKEELEAFITHSQEQKYNGDTAAEMVLVSPLWFEDLSATHNLPDGEEINRSLSDYSAVMKDVAHVMGVRFVDLLTASKSWTDYTVDGIQVNADSYKDVASLLADELFSGSKTSEKIREQVSSQVQEKNWYWRNDFKMPNGVHAYGRRHKPFGTENYPAEIEKIRHMTEIRDTAIWASLQGKSINVDSLDLLTRSLPEIETNYNPENIDEQSYKYGDDFLKTITTAPGYKVDIFASEEDFPDLANPCQLSFDDKGRLWVAVMPSYPHYEPGDGKPNDKIIILEDTDRDGKADKHIVYADGLHLPVGFEISHEGVYVSQGTHLKLLIDSDGDDQADREEILFSGFDDHDTHHNISAFCADPSGAIIMEEGIFLHTTVETAYGPQRSVDGGFWRLDPRKKKLDRYASLPIPNPWGVAYDQWGQDFFIRTSGPGIHWMRPSTVKQRYAIGVPTTKQLIESDHLVRPTSGVEFVSSRHFPDEVQGDMLVNNTIGFLGTKQHRMIDAGTGYETKFRQDLISSTDGNYRPVDLEFGPDGSLYMVDWHNILVGHMQHNARDPLRDHVHGRVLRITYPERPLVKEAKVHNASIAELFQNLTLPEYRTRYRTRRALRGKDKVQVFTELQTWKEGVNNERHLLEGLWVSWGIDKLDVPLLKSLLQAKDYKVRAAAVNVLRHNTEEVEDHLKLLELAAEDESGRVRMEAAVTASHLSAIDGVRILDIVERKEKDDWMMPALKYGRAHMNDENYIPAKSEEEILTSLQGKDKESFFRGKEIYGRDGMCKTCHQADGNGLKASGFPPLRNSEWVNKRDEVLIKITLKGIMGPISVAGKEYPGQVPMIGYEKLLNNEELADVLTYVKHAFGDGSSIITPEDVQYTRDNTKEQQTYYKPEDLLRIYPIQ